MHLTSGVVVLGWCYMYGYAIPLIYEYCMRHGPRLTGGGSPHIPHHDFQLHPRHAQLLPWFSDLGAWTMALNSSVVVQGWWYMYGHAIPLFYESYMRHGTCMAGVNHPTDHNVTSNYTPYMLSCYPSFRREEPYLCTSPVMKWSKEDDLDINMISHWFMSVIWGIDHVW